MRNFSLGWHKQSANVTANLEDHCRQLSVNSNPIQLSQFDAAVFVVEAWAAADMSKNPTSNTEWCSLGCLHFRWCHFEASSRWAVKCNALCQRGLWGVIGSDWAHGAVAVSRFLSSAWNGATQIFCQSVGKAGMKRNSLGMADVIGGLHWAVTVVYVTWHPSPLGNASYPLERTLHTVGKIFARHQFPEVIFWHCCVEMSKFKWRHIYRTDFPLHISLLMSRDDSDIYHTWGRNLNSSIWIYIIQTA